MPGHTLHWVELTNIGSVLSFHDVNHVEPYRDRSAKARHQTGADRVDFL
jgi:hypothetical protein